MNKLKNELELLLKNLEKSMDPIYSHDTVEEIKNKILGIINRINNTGEADKEEIEYLLAPTGGLQETSIDNGWGYEFIKIAENIELLI